MLNGIIAKSIKGKHQIKVVDHKPSNRNTHKQHKSKSPDLDPYIIDKIQHLFVTTTAILNLLANCCNPLEILKP